MIEVAVYDYKKILLIFFGYVRKKSYFCSGKTNRCTILTK